MAVERRELRQLVWLIIALAVALAAVGPASAGHTMESVTTNGVHGQAAASSNR